MLILSLDLHSFYLYYSWLCREMKEGKTPVPEPQHASADVLPEQLPAGLLGLEIPADVRDVLKVG